MTPQDKKQESGGVTQYAGIDQPYWLVVGPFTMAILAIGALAIFGVYQSGGSPRILVKTTPIFLGYGVVVTKLREVSGGASENAE